MMDSELKGKRFAITGASGGIGAAIAAALSAEGAALVLHYHTNRARADEVSARCGTPSMVVQADLREEAQVEAMFGAALSDGAKLDGIVVNAGIWIGENVPVHRMTLRQWEKTLATDLTGAFLSCRGFLRHLAEVPRQEASIVLIGSTAGLVGEAGHADYAAAKAALAYGLMTSLKNEIVALAPLGRVNCVCPGWVRTEMAESALAEPGVFERATATMPLKKVADPEDVARAVVYLSSPALSGHVSGVILPVHGGMEGRLVD